MNQTFVLSRFGKLLQTEFLINKSTIGKILSAFLLAMLLMYYLLTYVVGQSLGLSPEALAMFPNGYSIVSTFYSTVLWIIMFLLPLFVYYNLYDKVKSVSWIMLPASKLEKFLSAVLQTGILLPALLVLIFGICLFIIHSANFSAVNANWGELVESWLKDSVQFIQLQSFLFLGVFWFKENKIRKIILTLIGIVTLLIIIGFLFAAEDSLLYDVVFQVGTSGFGQFLEEHLTVVTSILFPLVPWIIAYKKFTRTQI